MVGGADGGRDADMCNHAVRFRLPRIEAVNEPKPRPKA